MTPKHEISLYFVYYKLKWQLHMRFKISCHLFVTKAFLFMLIWWPCPLQTEIFYSRCLPQMTSSPCANENSLALFKKEFTEILFAHMKKKASATSSRSFGNFRLRHEESEICLELQQWGESREKCGHLLLTWLLLIPENISRRK